MTTFRTSYPIDFNLYDKDTQNVLYIEDTSDQLLTLELRNASGQQIQLSTLINPVSNSNYHLALRFRAGTLSEASLNSFNSIQLTATTAESWEMTQPEQDTTGMDIIYLKSKAPDHILEPDTPQHIVFENVGASAVQGARGTRVELLYTNMNYSGELETISGNREIHLSVVNHRGKQDIPLHIGFVGDNGVLNDGTKDNTLQLRLTNALVYDPANPDLSPLRFHHDAEDATRTAKIILSFHSGDPSDEWALEAETKVRNISINEPVGWTLQEPIEGQSPEWILKPETEDVLLPGRDAPAPEPNYFDIGISNIVTAYPTGHTHLYVRYENIPGYWDGQQELLIEKRPLVFHDKNVGIGITDPEETLEVQGAIKSDALITGSIRSITAVWKQARELKAYDPQNGDLFGISVAINGDWAIVCKNGRGPAGGNDVGNAYVFHLENGQWIHQEPKLESYEPQSYDHFGFSVAISGDWAIIGAHESDTGGTDAGSAYLFHLENGQWVAQQPRLQAYDPQPNAYFGFSVAISGDWAIVGAYGDNTGGTDAGSAYVFHLENGQWVAQQTKLQAYDAQALDQFGLSVAISGDWAIVGAHGDNTGGDNAGSAYLFHLENGQWIPQQPKLQAYDAQAGDQFGLSVAISGDWAIVGAYGDSTGGTNVGSAYLFHLENGQWIPQQPKLQAYDAQAGDHFGFRVAISGDHAIVSAYGNNRGSDYAFRLENGQWVPQQLKLRAYDTQSGIFPGRFIAIDGDWTIVGASEDDTEGTDAGSAYLFHPEPAGQLILEEDMGYVGIGTATPTGNLHISSGSSGDCKLILESDTDNNNENDNPYIIFRQDGGVEESAIFQEGNRLTLANSVSVGEGIAFKTGNATNGYTNATERMRITGSGNIGIGTTTPLGALHISSGNSGDCKLILEADTDNSNENDNPYIIFRQDGGVEESAIFHEDNRLILANSVTIGEGIAFKTGNSINGYTNAIERMRITGSGNVGIGTTTPSRALHVIGNIYTSGAFETPGSDYAEYFESADDKAIPLGIAVVLEEAKVRAAREGECPIGIVSAQPMMVGNLPSEWPGKYCKDDFGRIQTNADGTPVLNPDYDPEKTYVSRTARPEWICIGLLGQLPLRKGQPVAPHWIKMKTISDSVALWLVK